MKLLQKRRELDVFRRFWTPPKILGLLEEHDGKLLICWPIGVGKSYSLDSLIEYVARQNLYDLVAVFLPTRRVVRERRWVQTPPADIKTVVLRPRPWRECGPNRNQRWTVLERRGLGLIGREQICAICPKKPGCFWPTQYGKELKDTKVIYGTQAHIQNSTDFISQIQNWTEGETVLVLIDENNFTLASRRSQLARDDLAAFAECLASADSADKPSFEAWLNLTQLLMIARTADLRSPQWRVPYLGRADFIKLIHHGHDRFGDEFNFIAYDLLNFCDSPPTSRERTTTGEIVFSTKSVFETDLIVYSGTLDPDFLEFRLNQKFGNPFGDYQFFHAGTRWYNIRSRLGMKKYFPGNASQIFDFFAALVARRLTRGRRPILVTKKCFADVCVAEMEKRLTADGHGDVRIIYGRYRERDLADPKVIPLISYGMIGTNKFEHFSGAYCLTGYYVNEEAINSALQDMTASDIAIPVKIETKDYPCQRIAHVENIADQYYEVNDFAQPALNQVELHVVFQAVGRVRPYTRPREIITFQCWDGKGVPRVKEFSGLDAIRRHFDIPDGRQRRRADNAALVQKAKKEGLSQAEAATRLDLSLSTVKRHWHPKRANR